MANARETHHEHSAHYLGKEYESGLKEVSAQDTDTMRLRE
jgi:hypothetical protein